MLVSYKVCLHYLVLSIIVCTIGYVCIFCGDQVFVYFVTFLSMIIYEVLYTYMMFKALHLQRLVFRFNNINLYSYVYVPPNFCIELIWYSYWHFICLLNRTQAGTPGFHKLPCCVCIRMCLSDCVCVSLCVCLFVYIPPRVITTSGSESRGQEEAACMCIIRPTRPLQQVFTRMVALNF